MLAICAHDDHILSAGMATVCESCSFRNKLPHALDEYDDVHLSGFPESRQPDLGRLLQEDIKKRCTFSNGKAMVQAFHVIIFGRPETSRDRRMHGVCACTIFAQDKGLHA